MVIRRGIGGLFLIKKVQGALLGVSRISSLVDIEVNKGEVWRTNPDPSSSTSLQKTKQKQFLNRFHGWTIPIITVQKAAKRFDKIW